MWSQSAWNYSSHVSLKIIAYLRMSISQSDLSIQQPCSINEQYHMSSCATWLYIGTAVNSTVGNHKRADIEPYCMATSAILLIYNTVLESSAPVIWTIFMLLSLSFYSLMILCCHFLSMLDSMHPHLFCMV